MPELPELRLMSDYINHSCKDKEIKKCYHVGKGNDYIESDIDGNFKIGSTSYGKELRINFKDTYFSVFMGMSGNWSYLPTKDVKSVKFTRLRFDTTDDMSLVLYGGYLGPKYKLGGFKTTNRGYDPTIDFDKFKEKIYSDINRIKSFQKPIYETLLDQRYFNGIGNYLRSEILYRIDDTPFKKGKDYIEDNPIVLELCKSVCEESYNLGGGQFKDWKNPFGKDKEKFNNWIQCYGKGSKIKDSNNRTFWFDSKTNHADVLSFSNNE